MRHANYRAGSPIADVGSVHSIAEMIPKTRKKVKIIREIRQSLGNITSMCTDDPEEVSKRWGHYACAPTRWPPGQDNTVTMPVWMFWFVDERPVPGAAKWKLADPSQLQGSLTDYEHHFITERSHSLRSWRSKRNGP